MNTATLAPFDRRQIADHPALALSFNWVHLYYIVHWLACFTDSAGMAVSAAVDLADLCRGRRRQHAHLTKDATDLSLTSTFVVVDFCLTRLTIKCQSRLASSQHFGGTDLNAARKFYQIDCQADLAHRMSSASLEPCSHFFVLGNCLEI